MEKNIEDIKQQINVVKSAPTERGQICGEEAVYKRSQDPNPTLCKHCVDVTSGEYYQIGEGWGDSYSFTPEWYELRDEDKLAEKQRQFFTDPNYSRGDPEDISCPPITNCEPTDRCDLNRNICWDEDPGPDDETTEWEGREYFGSEDNVEEFRDMTDSEKRGKRFGSIVQTPYENREEERAEARKIREAKRNEDEEDYDEEDVDEEEEEYYEKYR